MSKQDPSESLHSLTNIFDPVMYIKAHYSGPENSPCQQDTKIVEWTSDKIHSLFTGGHFKGKTILGVGTGPVVKDVITASQWFDEIFLTDISKENVAFLRKWMAGDSEATKAMKYQISEFTLKDGKSTSWEAKNEQVRMKVKDAMVWDMNKPEMLKGTALDGVLVDCVISCLNVCTTSSTIDDYFGVIKNISDMLKSGDHLVVLDVMDQSSYTVGDKTFSLFCTTPEQIKRAFLQNGFEIEHFETHDLGDCPKTITYQHCSRTSSKMAKKVLFNSETNVFDPIMWIRSHYCGPENCQKDMDEMVQWSMDTIHRMFVGGQYSGKTLLDIGTGPVVYSVITASEWFDEVFLSDISKDNVAFLQKWMSGDEEATEAMKYQMTEFALKGGKGTSWEAKNEHVRMKVKDAIVWDMRRPEMLKGTALEGVRFDFVTSCLSMAPATSSIDGYMGIIRNISGLLKPGGHFVILEAMDQTTYTVGDQTFGLLCVTEDEIKTAFLQNGFEIELFETHRLISPKTAFCDAESVYCIVGRKL